MKTILLALASLASLALPTFAIGCSAASSNDDDTQAAEGAVVVATSSPWSGVYDLAAKTDRDPSGSLRVYSLNQKRLILVLHARVTPEGSVPEDGQGTIRIDTPIPVVGTDKAVYSETRADENLEPVPNASGCKVDIARQANGDLDVQVTHCKNAEAHPFSFGPVRFVRRASAPDPYAGDYRQTGYFARSDGYALHVDPVASGATQAKMTLTNGAGGSFPIVGALGRAGLVANIVDSSGCKGFVSFRADGVDVDPVQGDCPPAVSGGWSIDDLVEMSFADPAAPTASDNYRTARRMPGG